MSDKLVSKNKESKRQSRRLRGQEPENQVETVGAASFAPAIRRSKRLRGEDPENHEPDTAHFSATPADADKDVRHTKKMRMLLPVHLVLERCDVVSPVDINQMIPEEIIFKIFSYLPRPDLLNGVARVCTKWNRMSSDPCLWHRPSFIDELELNDGILQRLTRLSRNVKSLNVTSCPAITDKGLLAVMEQCSTMKKLQISR